MKKLHPRCRKKRSVVFMVLTVHGLPEKTTGQLLGFPATGSEVTSAAIQGSKELVYTVPMLPHSMCHSPASKWAH